MAPEAETKTVKAPQLELRGLDRTPAWFSRFIETNGLAHVLGHLVGLDGDQSRLLTCTADGKLNVESAGAGGGESVGVPFWAATEPDTRALLEAVGIEGGANLDYGSAGNRRIAYAVAGESEHQAVRVHDASAEDVTDKLLLPATYYQITVAYTTERYLYFLSMADGTTYLNVHSWDL